MKLRNKKTGEIENVCFAKSGDEICVVVEDMPICGNSVLGEYDSLAELNEEWEDEPTEPRIEHEDSRKAVWYWASTNQVDRVRCVKDYRKGIGITRFCAEEYNSCPHIEFRLLDANVEDGEIYTIDELCREVEAPEPLEPTYVDLDERIREKEEEMTKNKITLGEPGSLDMVADFETRQVRLCAAGDSYYDNFVSFDDFLGFAEELKEALEEEEE